MRYTIGCVPYVNARPLVDVYDQPNPDVAVLYDVPSRLPTLLRTGEVDAILVSSIEALRRRESYVAGLVGIISRGPVESVRIFSKKPIQEIESLALDASSMTSNCLAQIILAEGFGVHPSVVKAPPNLRDMLHDSDACVIIGDLGMTTSGDGLHVLDLGEEWSKLTGLPFVWAVWLLAKPDEELVGRLEHPLLELSFPPDRPFGLNAKIEDMIAGNTTEEFTDSHPTFHEVRAPFLKKTAERYDMPLEQVSNYLEHTIAFWMTQVDWEGLMTFGEMLVKHRLLDNWWEPVRIFANPGVINVPEEDRKLMTLFRRGSAT